MTSKDIPKTCLQCKQLLQSEPLRWGVRWFCECGCYEVIELNNEGPLPDKFIPEVKK